MNDRTFVRYQPKLHLGPITDALKAEELPEIGPEPTALGRYRLVMALQNKFGENFRNNPLASKAIQHYDTEWDYFKRLRQIQGGQNAKRS